MINEPLKIAIATGTRADWGLLTPLAHALAARDDVELMIIATNMHLDARYGMTVNEIIAEGLPLAATVDMKTDGDGDLSRVTAMAKCLDGFGRVFDRLKPDMVVILGDRYEMLSVATAAAMMKIAIVHIAGGVVSEGAIDDAIRHAITKLSSLHLTETERYRHRVIQMGEAPETVVATGALGVWNIGNQSLMSREELSADIGFDFGGLSAVVTFHPATLDPADPGERCGAMLGALERFGDMRLLITYPNNDARSAAIIERIEDFGRRHPQRVKVVKSLGMRRFLSALKCVDVVIGNSSGGIVEVPSCGIPTVDIGIRQRGRDAAGSVIHCGDTADEIAAAIEKALSPEMQTLAARCDNPYYQPDTPSKMIDAIMGFAREKHDVKRFNDLDFKL